MRQKDALKTVLESQKKIIRPAETSIKKATAMIERINTLLKKAKLDADCVAGGSYAKGTILKNDFDIDLFARFDYSYKDKDISEMLEKAIKSLKPEVLHGSRDYYQIIDKGLLFEIIPVLRIKDHTKALNVTDMSPLHVDYVRRYYSRKSKLADEVRLSKKFCKGIKAYGAESHIRGFSGHVLDLLIIYYGSFQNLLMQASVWGERVIIDMERHHEDPLKELNNSKTISPLIVVDPIQPSRNAAAAISKEKFELFKNKAREFLAKPGKAFFEVKKIDLSSVKKDAGKDWLLIIKIKPLIGKKDVVGTKVLKCYEYILRKITECDFKVLKHDWDFGNESLMYFVIKREHMSPEVELTGPPIRAKEDAARFRERHKRIIEKNNRLYAIEKRPYPSPDKLIKKIITEEYITEKVKQIRLM